MDTGSAFAALLLSIDALLRKGLGERTKVIALLLPSSSPRPIHQALPSTSDVIHIGLVYHPQHATRLVDQGPAAGDQDQDLLTAFRELWGEKAELRRFKDGRIVESVVWDVKTADDRAHVPAAVVQYLLQRHFNIPASSSETNVVQGWQTTFDSMLRLPEEVSKVYLNGGLPVGYKSALSAFDGLVKTIKDLDDDLPLATLNVSPICEALRYTSVFAPVPLTDSLAGILPPNARYLPYMDLVIEFEKSSKWPDDLKAIQKIKLAFFERVAEQLMKKVGGLKARVVTGDGVHESNLMLDQSFLEALTPEGWAFALRIWNPREAVLLDRIIAGHDKFLPHVKPLQQNKQKNLIGKEYHDAVYAKEVYTRRFIHGPRHHRAIASLCHRYSAYAGTVRLVKRWLAAHWVLGPGKVSEEAVELISAKIFVGDDGKYVGMDVDSELAINQPGVPGAKERGFACVVDFLRKWKWEEGMHVPLYSPSSDPGQAFLAEAEMEVMSGGDSGTKGQPNGKEKAKEVKASSTSAWTISTEFDKEGKMWTSHGPDVVVAHRVRALSEATWGYMENLEKGNINVQVGIYPPAAIASFLTSSSLGPLRPPN
jgi:U3 small nucleolar RNA-associated protein 22